MPKTQLDLVKRNVLETIYSIEKEQMLLTGVSFKSSDFLASFVSSFLMVIR